MTGRSPRRGSLAALLALAAAGETPGWRPPALRVQSSAPPRPPRPPRDPAREALIAARRKKRRKATGRR